MIDKYFKRSKYFGSFNSIASKGIASIFNQPWYWPLPCNERNTGMAIGGIGNSIIISPDGRVPIVSFYPGVQIRPEMGDDVGLNRYYYQETILDGKNELEISNLYHVKNRLSLYPILKSNGETFPNSFSTFEDAIDKIKNELKEINFYFINKQRLEKWGIEYSERTQNLINTIPENIEELNLSWLFDFFEGIIGRKSSSKGSLLVKTDETSDCDFEKFNPDFVRYKALFPCVETEYKTNHSVIRKRQWSPVIPGDEYHSSLPTSFSDFSIKNISQGILDITIVFCCPNLIGSTILKDREGSQDASFILQRCANNQYASEIKCHKHGKYSSKSIIVGQKENFGDIHGSMGIGVTKKGESNISLSIKPMIYSSSKKYEIQFALRSGRVSSTVYHKHFNYTGRELTDSLVCVNARIARKSRAEFTVCLVLDIPRIKLTQECGFKKYTMFFKDQNSCEDILKYSQKKHRSLRNKIHNTYSKLYDDSKKKLCSSMFKGDKFLSIWTLAMNSMSFIAEASVWMSDGRFYIRECTDYPFFNSIDVYFYGSFGLLTFFPMVDKKIMQQFSQTVRNEDTTIRRYNIYSYQPTIEVSDPNLEDQRSYKGSVAHDLGSPFDFKPNAYIWHNTKGWKDLNPKYVLLVYRQYFVDKDIGFLIECKKDVYAAIDYLAAMLNDGEHVPLTNGTDDTFDNLKTFGVSIYSGSLWAACLQAGAKTAQLCGDLDISYHYSVLAKKAKNDLVEILWDGENGYFHNYRTIVSTKDFTTKDAAALQQLMPDVLGKCTTLAEIVKSLNAYILNPESRDTRIHGQDSPRIESVSTGRGMQIISRKMEVLKLFEGHVNSDLREKLLRDSDDVFADQLAADNWMRLLRLDPIFSDDQSKRSLLTIHNKNFLKNSPCIGAVNLARFDGTSLPEDNFQANDIWIGIQYSILLGYLHHNLKDEYWELFESIYRGIYYSARIPFSSPEGFLSIKITPSLLVSGLKVSATAAESIISHMKKHALLTNEGKMARKYPMEFENFKKIMAKCIGSETISLSQLHGLILRESYKYTAGRYLRPGMIWASFFV